MLLRNRIFLVDKTKTRELGTWDTEGGGIRIGQLHTLACGLPLVSVVNENGEFTDSFFVRGAVEIRPGPLYIPETHGLALTDIKDVREGNVQHFAVSHATETKGEGVFPKPVRFDASGVHIVLVPGVVEGELVVAHMTITVSEQHITYPYAPGTQVSQSLQLRLSHDQEDRAMVTGWDFASSGPKLEFPVDGSVDARATPQMHELVLTLGGRPLDMLKTAMRIIEIAVPRQVQSIKALLVPQGP